MRRAEASVPELSSSFTRLSVPVQRTVSDADSSNMPNRDYVNGAPVPPLLNSGRTGNVWRPR